MTDRRTGPRLSGRDVSPERKERARELLKLGLTQVIVQSRTGLSQGLVSRIAREIKLAAVEEREP